MHLGYSTSTEDSNSGNPKGFLCVSAPLREKKKWM